MKIILAIDSFKGCMDSERVESVFAGALHSDSRRILSIPMSDGGEGMLGAFCSALNAQIATCTAHDPLMRTIEAEYGITPDGAAIIETARACGLTLMSKQELDPISATSYGVGEIIADAISRGCRKFIVGLGGSGTSDAGIGMLKALTERYPDRIPGHCSFLLACDVDNPLYGPNGAAHVFGPQKGAGPDIVEQLDIRARDFAMYSALRNGRDCSGNPGAGAAGGLGYAFMQYLDAQMRPGADLLFELCGFDRMIADADLVITGEGHADRQTLMGKLPFRVLLRSSPYGIPVWLVAGKVDDKRELLSAGFSRVDAISPESMDEAEAARPTTAARNIREWAASISIEMLPEPTTQ